ncbi:MAG: peptide-methionine (S)-S-oxide reductase MsrA [Gemmatimonadales bacterium]
MPAYSRLTVPALATIALVAAASMSMSLPGFGTPRAAVTTAPMPPEPAPAGVVASSDTAVFAGGCFWGVEAVFEHLAGVSSATSGYAGGSAASPTYEQVSSGATGHAEAVLVIYDPGRISYDQLLQIFFTVAHDPTQLNRQGPDVGTQYRSAVFYRNQTQRAAAERYIAKVGEAKLYPGKVVTEVAPLGTFHQAEAYHQDYLVRHPTQPYIVINDAPKLEHLRREFPALYRKPGVS